MRIFFNVLILIVFLCLGVISFATILDRIAELKCAKWYPVYIAPKKKLSKPKKKDLFVVNLEDGSIVLSLYDYDTSTFDIDRVIAYRPLYKGLCDTYSYKMRRKLWSCLKK